MPLKPDDMQETAARVHDSSLTCKTIPKRLLENLDLDLDPTLLRAPTPPKAIERNAHLSIRRSTLGLRAKGETRPLEYTVEEKIGEGACGVVYAASQNTIDREVAIKVIRPEMAQDTVVKSLFLSEAVVTGDLDHPNIVPIYDLGVDQRNCLFYAMKKIKGVPWSKVIAEKSEAENLDILLRVCDAIAFSHAKGVIHRDLKPQNIMLGDFGEVFVMDWGIAVSPMGNGKAEILTAESNQAGTPIYMAPEMADTQAGSVTHLSDIYLLGGLLYQIETGLTPHASGNLKECLIKVIHNIIQPTHKTSELIDIAVKAMATDPARRYQSVSEFSQAVRDYRSHAQSIALCKNASETHAKARKTKAYPDFLMALFGYENALVIWPDNPQASVAKTKVNLDYAGAAYAKDDFDLALSLLDARNASHQALLGKVRSAKQARLSHQKHIKWLKLGSVSLALLTLVIVTIGLVLVKIEKDRAVLAEQKMRIAQTQALQEYYYNAIALASRKLGDQQYGQVQLLLKKLPENMRGWEWGRLSRLCNLDLHTFQGHDQPVVAVAFSPDESYIATADRGSTIKLWNLSTGQDIDTFSDFSGRIEDIRFAQDGRHILVQKSDGSVVSWDIDSGTLTKVAYRAEDDEIYMFYSPDHAYFIKRTLEPTALIQKTKDNQLVHPLQGHTDSIYAAAFSPDSTQVVTGAADKTAIIWDIATGRRLLSLKGHGAAVQAVKFSPSGRYVLTGSTDRSVKLWSAQSDRDQKRFVGHQSFISCLVFSPDNATLATSSHDGTVKIWDIATQKMKWSLKGHIGRVHAVHYTPDGRFLISAGADNQAIVWDVASGAIKATLTGHSHSIFTVDVSPDGRYAATGSWDRTIKLWDLTTYREVATWQGHEDAVISLRFSPDGRSLVSGGKDRVARVWEVASGKTIHVLDTHAASIYAVAYAKDGRFIATGSWDKTIKIWDAATGHVRQTLTGHAASVYAIVFTDNEKRLISAGWDKSVKIWDIQTGQELMELGSQSAPISSVCVSRDGMMVAAAGRDNTAVVWEADPYHRIQDSLTQ